MPFVPAHPRLNRPNLGCSEAAEGRARLPLPPPTGAVHPHGSAVPLPHGGGGSLHPDAGRVLDADAGRLALTHDESEAIAVEAERNASKHGGPFAWWVAYLLHDIQHAARDRNGRRQFANDNP